MTENKLETIRRFWQLFDAKRWDELLPMFHAECKIVWPNTSEDFTPEAYLRLNREYPGNWQITLEDVTEAQNKVISVIRINSVDNGQSLRGIGYFHLQDGLIYYLLEYFAEDTAKPDWRR